MRFPSTAHGIKRTGPCKVAGVHLSEAPNEPAFDEPTLLAADRELSASKIERSDHEAFVNQIRMSWEV